MRYLKPLLIVLSIFFLPLKNFCQKPSAVGDSIALIAGEQSSIELQRLHLAKLQDSLRKAELEQQVRLLKSNQEEEKLRLLKELGKLKSRDSLRLEKQKKKIDSLRVFMKGYPVHPFRDTLFFLYSHAGSFSPLERVAAVSSRIRVLSEKYNFNPDSIKVVTGDLTFDIMYGDAILMGVSDEDALWNNTSRELLSVSYKKKIAEAIIRHRQETSWKMIIKEVVLVLLVVGVVVFIINRIGRFFGWIRVKVEAQEGKRINGIKIRNYQLFTTHKQTAFILSVLSFIKFLLIILVIYLALPVLVTIFPGTEGLAGQLLAYVLNPLNKILRSLWAYVPNLITIIVIVVVFRYFLKLLNFFKLEIKNGALKIHGFYADWAEPTYQLLRVLVLAFMMIVVFPYLPGSESPVFKGVSVFLGVLFTFGSAGALGNVVAGLVLTYMRAFKVGDRVKIGEVTGDIIERSLLVTRIRTIKNEIISVPNSAVMNSHTINFSSDAASKGLIIHTTVTVGYDVPWRKVHQVLIDAAMNTDLVEKDPLPFVLQTSLEDFYAAYQINAYTKYSGKQAAIYSHLYQNIQDKFHEAGIEITSPHYHAVRDGNAAAMPPGYLPGDYSAPAFRVVKTEDNLPDKL
ncbi:mechanosensitive ion channel family protein [Pararcticibacter amylolyticus]|uniref:Transmembrane ion channel n=1 Tax=Pararcticibacter amylolyticus TaxID=2173175 RepID=A0A2U2PBY6_9SPHI|nr:mechanosensitive ion channel family protein [Pararcticibacter amylolyticus]PWG78917.1 transmembrane ion channel [Pararcticibacter amylolyticus]